MLLSILGLINICLCAVVELTPDSFDTLVKSQYSLVEFFAPWCGHCKLLAPIYAQVAEAYASTDKILIASVDVDKYPELGKKFGIKGFPTIKWFGKDKEPVTYDKGRTLDDFIDFIAEQTGVESKSSKVEKVSKVVIADPDSMPEITKGLALVEFFAPWCGHCKKLAPIYEQLADIFANDEHCVVASLDGDRFTAMAETFDIKGYPTLMFFEKGVQTSYEGGRTLKDMVAFLNGKCNTHRTLDGTLDGKV